MTAIQTGATAMRDEATGSSPGRPLPGKLLPGRRLAGLAGAVTVGALFIGQAGLASGATAGRGEAGLSAARAVASAAAYTPTNKTFKFGERGPGILALQHRLLRLHYFVGTLNGIFDWGTQEAVWAFKEVQSGKIAPAHPNRVDPAMQRQLVHPKAPPVKFPHGGSLRIEV